MAVSAAACQNIKIPMHANRLIKEKSPYLLQHAHNPVDWYPWGEEAFLKAKREDRPVFVSIGYSTCHWCHVMEHESFENETIAKILNDHFVSIKVDREERPDLDGVYMAVVMALTGQGGWPLNVFLTPDKKPFFGGTYFPPYAKWGAPGLGDLLLTIHESWSKRRQEILDSGESITRVLRQRTEKANAKQTLDEKIFDLSFEQFSRSFDSSFGGFGSSPKFPSSHNLSFLLRYHKRAKSERALEMVEKTLSKMEEGGIRDSLGGGFHRYSTDQKWHIPHFEKMLYDQATLAKTYLEAYQVTKKKEYADVAREIFDYVLRDMRDKDGGFYSAEDADSTAPEEEGHPGALKKEGAFYIWKASEIEDILGKGGAAVFNFCFGVEAGGNAEHDPHQEFTGKNILYAAHDAQEAAKKFHKTSDEIKTILNKAKQKLFLERNKRPKPHLDDKVLVDWNGLMISSLSFGARVLDEPRYAEAAEKAAQFILKNLVKGDGRLLHRYRDGEAAIEGTLDDYVFLTDAFFNLYETTFDVQYLKKAKELNERAAGLFFDKENKGFFVTAFDAEELLFRQKEFYDGAMPSGNAVMLSNLLKQARYTDDAALEETARQTLEAFFGTILQNPTSYTQSLIALDYLLSPSREVVVVGSPGDAATGQLLKMISKDFSPHQITIFYPEGTPAAPEILKLIPFVAEYKPLNGKPTVYVCENHVCRLPICDLESLQKVL